MIGSTSPGEAGAPVSWPALRREDPHALEATAGEARELARVLAVESIASDADAELAELEERRRHLSEAAWPSEPLEGFELQSSLGAFVVARVAIAWVPAGQVGLRRRPQSPDALGRALVQHGVEPVTARSVLGDWAGAPDDFRGDVAGLDASRLAGLAERSLTSEEREAALAQVAVSPRDLARLGATLTLGRAVRRLLPVLPSDGLGSELAATLALVATDRAERALELLPESPGSLREVTVRELAETVARLGQGQPVELSADPWAPLLRARSTLPAEVEAPSVAEAGDVAEPVGEGSELTAPEALPADGSDDAAPAASDAGEDPFASEATPVDEEEDVLEILEERVDPETRASGARWRARAAPELPPGWPAAGSGALAWERLAAHRSLARERGGLLGLAGAPLDPRGGPVPPDPRLIDPDDGLTERIDLDGLALAPRIEGSDAEPFLPPVRSALRCVVAACEGGELPPAEAGGGLGWAVARARALAAVARGALEPALLELEGYSDDEAPERRWIRDRQVRYEGREAAPLAPDEARAAAAGLALDLARSLARTLTGVRGASLEEDTD